MVASAQYSLILFFCILGSFVLALITTYTSISTSSPEGISCIIIGTLLIIFFLTVWAYLPNKKAYNYTLLNSFIKQEPTNAKIRNNIDLSILTGHRVIKYNKQYNDSNEKFRDDYEIV